MIPLPALTLTFFWLHSELHFQTLSVLMNFISANDFLIVCLMVHPVVCLTLFVRYCLLFVWLFLSGCSPGCYSGCFSCCCSGCFYNCASGCSFRCSSGFSYDCSSRCFPVYLIVHLVVSLVFPLVVHLFVPLVICSVCQVIHLLFLWFFCCFFAGNIFFEIWWLTTK